MALLTRTGSSSPMMTRYRCASVGHGSRTYHDDLPELLHERWPNQTIEDRDWVAHGETEQFWRVVRWSSGWKDWVRNNSRNFTDAYTIQLCFGSRFRLSKDHESRSKTSRCSHGNQLHVSYRDFSLTTPVWTSFCGSATRRLLDINYLFCVQRLVAS